MGVIPFKLLVLGQLLVWTPSLFVNKAKATSDRSEQIQKRLAEFVQRPARIEELICPQNNSRSPASVASQLKVVFKDPQSPEKQELDFNIHGGQVTSIQLSSLSQSSMNPKELKTWKSFRPVKNRFQADAIGRKNHYLILTQNQKDSSTRQLEKLVPQILSCCESSGCRQSLSRSIQHSH